MKTVRGVPLAAAAILTIAEIKTAADAFDRGDANVFEALDVIVMAVDGYRGVLDRSRRDERSRREAA